MPISRFDNNKVHEDNFVYTSIEPLEITPLQIINAIQQTQQDYLFQEVIAAGPYVVYEKISVDYRNAFNIVYWDYRNPGDYTWQHWDKPADKSNHPYTISHIQNCPSPTGCKVCCAPASLWMAAHYQGMTSTQWKIADHTPYWPALLNLAPVNTAAHWLGFDQSVWIPWFTWSYITTETANDRPWVHRPIGNHANTGIGYAIDYNNFHYVITLDPWPDRGEMMYAYTSTQDAVLVRD
ncbi:MAG: hypothetical protein ACTSW4_03095 [Candidatus Ranarchaeia archaeon]